EKGLRVLQLLPLLLVPVEQVVHRPKRPLPRRAHREPVGRRSIGVDLRDREVDENQLYLTGADVVPVQCGQRRLPEGAAEGTLEIAEFEYRDRGIGAAPRALGEHQPGRVLADRNGILARRGSSILLRAESA